MKSIINQGDINSIKNRLYYKIFNIIIKDNCTYYLDYEFNLIWNEEKEIVGIINNNNNIYFEDIDNIMNTIY